jgi:hypothetical protein
MKMKSVATHQQRRPAYPDQCSCVHTNSTAMEFLVQSPVVRLQSFNWVLNFLLHSQIKFIFLCSMCIVDIIWFYSIHHFM